MAIFVVEPDKNRETQTKALLMGAGFGQVQIFESHPELLEALGIKAESPAFYHPQVDLILLNGIAQVKDFEVIGAIRGNYRYQDVPIIITSESREPEFVQMLFAFGANDFVTEPIAQVELIARIRACLRLKHEIDRRRAREAELTEVSKQLSELNAWLARLSLLDGLTRISNRRAFDETLLQEWKRAVRNKTPVGLLMIDVDYFKQYNDSAGHRAGDSCLKQIATEIRNVLNRPADMLCRYGGDEFSVLLPDTDLKGVQVVGEKVQKHIESLRIPHGAGAPKPYVTVTVGGASWYPVMSDAMTDLIQNADEALYQAKRAGRNSVVALEAPQSNLNRLKDAG